MRIEAELTLEELVLLQSTLDYAINELRKSYGIVPEIQADELQKIRDTLTTF